MPVYPERASAVFGATSAVAVTPHDVNELPFPTRGIYVGGAGNLAVKLSHDSAAVTFAAVPAGSVLPIRAVLILATGTSATSIVALT